MRDINVFMIQMVSFTLHYDSRPFTHVRRGCRRLRSRRRGAACGLLGCSALCRGNRVQAGGLVGGWSGGPAFLALYSLHTFAASGGVSICGCGSSFQLTLPPRRRQQEVAARRVS